MYWSEILGSNKARPIAELADVEIHPSSEVGNS